MNIDIRNLQKWLNEEQEAPIDRQALARVLAMAEQPAQQEPVALGYMNAGHVHEMQQGRLPYGYVYPKGGAGANVAIYTSPPAQRKPLTDEEIEQCMKQAYATVQGRNLEHAFAHAIEAKLRSKNEDRN